MDVTAFATPGYDVPKNQTTTTNKAGNSQPSAVPYKIPPVVWMFVFLVAGFYITRAAIEEI